MAIKFQLSSVTLGDNTKIAFTPDSITVIVGPNNAGKSCFLKDIYQITQMGHSETTKSRKVIKQVDFEKSGDQNEYKDFLRNNTREINTQSGNTVLKALNVEASEDSAISWWNNHQNGLRNVTNLHCTLADTLSRLTIVSPPNAINLLSDTPQHPIHTLYDNEDLEKKLSTYVSQAFGDDLILNRGAGSILPLHIGKRPIIKPNEDRVSKPYLRELEKIPLVHEQGDGVKSFVGCLLSTTTLIKSITLLDEPEAFLHPPQARLLGSLLASEHSRNQLILATHSGDVLRGILDSNPPNLNVLRITREHDVNIAFTLDPNDLKKFWSDPVLRFSNILDGLFHEAVIICEADADCRFYSAIMASIHDGVDGKLPKRKPDVLFVASGGKDRIPKIAQALLKIKQKTHVIVDFDLLNDKQKTKLLYETLGGTWENVDADFKTIKSAIDKLAPSKNAQDICKEIRNILLQIESDGDVKKNHKNHIANELRLSRAWSTAKTTGIDLIPNGSDKDAANNLIRKFKEVGLWLVPYGELESFDKTIGGKSTFWIAKILEKDIATSPDFERARNFVTDISGSLNKRE